jgi:hypothetical protein
MRHITRPAFAIVQLAALALALTACGGGGSDGPNIAPTAPTVTLTANPTNVVSGATATLTWSSTNANSCSASGGWSGSRGTSGTEATAALSANATFTLVCNGPGGSGTASVTVTVGAVVGNVSVTGTITFARVPISDAVGLDFANTRQDPARGITVEVLNLATSAIIASGATDASGRYAFMLPGNTQVQIRARAELLRSAAGPLPRWQVRVSDLSATAAPYTYGSAPFNTASGAVQDLAIPSGWNTSTRQPSGTRSAAPFAILDTIYQAIQLILSVAPTADFPALSIDWSETNPGGETFYASSGTDRRIVLGGEVNVDPDEYDPHTIAHEFGHYIEDTFSRSDSIGGPHGFGDILDPRVAFGEGFGYAFAAIVLNDPVVRDVYGNNQSQVGRFSVETDETLNEGWFSESSVQEILWDLFDSGVEAGDTVALGFAPIWAVLTGTQRNTDAFTTIFSFITDLKAANPSAVAGIDSRVAAERIQAVGMDIYGTTETNLPPSGVAAEIFPIYTSIAIDGLPRTLRVSDRHDPFEDGNKLAATRFLRLSVGGPRTVRVTATSAIVGRDIDIRIMRRGVTVAQGVTEFEEDFTATLAAGEYAIDVYDCGFAACNDPQTGTNDVTVNITSN